MTQGQLDPPMPHQIRTWQDAELNAAVWMRFWGYEDAVARPGGPDGGVDVRATGALGQVKFRASQVGRGELQQLVGARAHATDAQLLFFTGSHYAATSTAYAEQMHIALFHYALDGRMTALNGAAQQISAAPAVESPGGVQQTGAGTATAKKFLELCIRNWRVLTGAFLLIAPFAYLGNDQLYTGPFALDAVKFLGILFGCWLTAAALFAWQALAPHPPEQLIIAKICRIRTSYSNTVGHSHTATRTSKRPGPPDRRSERYAHRERLMRRQADALVHKAFKQTQSRRANVRRNAAFAAGILTQSKQALDALRVLPSNDRRRQDTHKSVYRALRRARKLL
jgi:hypothetical protein